MQTKTIIYAGLILMFGLGCLAAFCHNPATARADNPVATTVPPSATPQPNTVPKSKDATGQAVPASVDTAKKDIRVTAPAASAVQVDLWLDRKEGVYKSKQTMTLSYQAKQDCYVSLFQFNPDQTIDRIFPTPENSFNFLEAGRIYTLKADAGLQAGNYVLKAVATLDPSNAVQPGVKFKGGAMPAGPLRVIPTAQAVLFTDWELTRFFSLPADRYDQKQVGYMVKQ